MPPRWTVSLTEIKGVLCPITVMYCRVDESLLTGRYKVVGSTSAEHKERSERDKRKKKV